MSAVVTAPSPVIGRIGPNAILQTIEALRTLRGDQELSRVFAAAGLSHHLDEPPQAMVDEREVARLHQYVRAHYSAAIWQSIMSDAGQRTGEYIISHRIPMPVRWLLQGLPAAPACRLLSSAIARHAWTFVGSGEFRVRPGRPVRIEIGRNPIVAAEQAERPVCYWHVAVFATLFRRLVTKSAQAIEVDCCAAGAPACIFEIDY
jgi:divinyl protochlorophyllide a 8-vinyl-reductase